MLPKTHRIKDRALVKKLFEEGRVYKNRVFIFRFMESPDENWKFAVMLSKKMTKTAVERNKLRKRVYSAIRLRSHQFKKPLIALAILKNHHPLPNFQEISEGLDDFIKLPL